MLACSSLPGMAKAPLKVPVTNRALIQRINRALVPQNQVLRARRGSGGWSPDVGDYFTIDLEQKAIARTNLDLVEFARKLGVLDPWETLIEKKAGGRRR